jgi:phosphatidylinositol-3-phosphatase
MVPARFGRFTLAALGALFLVLIEAGPHAGATQALKCEPHHPIRHVFVVVLENENFSTTFGPTSPAPYLSQTLTKQGALLTQYYGTGHASLDNYLSMISGQANNPETSADCSVFGDFKSKGVAANGQLIGSGCVYPAKVATIASQLTGAGLTWKGYMGDMGNDPSRESATCGHPIVNQPDLTEAAEAPSAKVPLGDSYATRHNPFVYFHSVIDSPLCNKNVVNLNVLTQDLKSAETTPNLSFITPSLCDDGHDGPCADGRPGGLVSINVFLKRWVPLILDSPAYKQDGVLIINFDEGSYGSVEKGKDGSVTLTMNGEACCNQQAGPNLKPFPQANTFVNGPHKMTINMKSFGGERTGAVVLSPFIKPGTVSDVPYNHYSLLKSIEDIFGIKEHLGYAGQAGLVGFGCDLFAQP